MKLKPTKKRTRASVPGQGKQLEYTYLNVVRNEQSQLQLTRAEYEASRANALTCKTETNQEWRVEEVQL